MNQKHLPIPHPSENSFCAVETVQETFSNSERSRQQQITTNISVSVAVYRMFHES